MRKVSIVLAATAALMGGTAMVSAADLIIDDGVVAVETYDPADWSGLYAGLHIGLGAGQIGDIEGSDVSIGGAQSAAIIGIGEDEYGYNLSGFLAGAQIGGMFQTGMFVLGIQGDVSWAHLNGDYTGVPDGITDEATIEWLATLTGRAGVAMDNVLLYALAGLALAGGHSDYDGDVVNHSFTGYTVGVGASVKLDDNWSIFAEYAYSGFGEEDVYYPMHDESYVYDLDVSTFKVGFNYRF